MKRTWPIIGVNDVEASSAWYLSLFGQAWRPTGHDDEFDQILDDDGTVLICLHKWGAHDEAGIRRGKKENGRLLDGREWDELPNCPVAAGPVPWSLAV